MPRPPVIHRTFPCSCLLHFPLPFPHPFQVQGLPSAPCICTCCLPALPALPFPQSAPSSSQAAKVPPAVSPFACPGPPSCSFVHPGDLHSVQCTLPSNGLHAPPTSSLIMLSSTSYPDTDVRALVTVFAAALHDLLYTEAGVGCAWPLVTVAHL